MSFSRRIELVSGIATGLLWFAYPLVLGSSVGRLRVEEFFSAFIILGIPGLLVAVGAYAHTVGGNPWGRVMLIVGSSILILIFLLLFFGGAAYYGVMILLSTFAPSITGIITVIASRANDFDGA